MDMADYLSDFDIFAERMRTKIIECSGKHKDDKTALNDLKSHFIDELLEMFLVEDKDEVIAIKHILLSHDIDENETHDVANMCWILSFFIRNGGK